jgi:hypothetical protein
MKRFALPILVLGSMMAIATGSHAQACANSMAIYQPCSGPNNCNSGVSVNRLYFGSVQYCMEESFLWCCSTQIPDWNSVGYCNEGGECEDLAFLKDPAVLEFSLTHTLWVKDCKGRFGPLARSWEAPEKPINLRPRLALSGIGR